MRDARHAHRGFARALGIAAIGSVLIAATPAAAQSPESSPAPMGSPAASAAPSVTPMATPLAVTLADFTVSPDPIEVSGPTVSFDVTNEGPTPHNLTIRDAADTVLGSTSDLSPGQEARLTVTVPAPGTYITFCSLPGHESLGMVGELIVTEDVSASLVPSTATAASPSPGS